MKIVKLGSRKIKVYFNEKAVDKYEKTARGKKDGYCHGYCDRGKDEIYIRSGLPNSLKRLTFWHELNHLHFDWLTNLGNESIAEINSRYIDEVFSRNRWVRELYEEVK